MYAFSLVYHISYKNLLTNYYHNLTNLYLTLKWLNLELNIWL